MRHFQSGYHTGGDSDERLGAAPLHASKPTVSLPANVVLGVRWISLASATRATAHALQLVILARLLAPADFGIMAVVATLTTYVQLLANLELSGAIIRGPEPSADQRSGLYWFGLAASGSLGLALAAAGHWIADFYGHPVLRPLLALAAVYLVVWAGWQQLQAFAERELRFGRVALIEAVSAIVGLVASVWLALLGAGVYALMGGLLASGGASALLGWRLLAGGWRPRLRLRLSEFREYLRVGGYTTASDVTAMLGYHVDIILGARFLGAGATGIYSVPKSLCQQVLVAIGPVATRVGLPVMAKASGDAAKLRRIYLRTIRLTASATFPLFALLCVFAPELVRLLLGPQWDHAAPVLRIFAAWGLMRGAVYPIRALAVAAGRSELLFRWSAAFLGLHVVAVYAAGPYGPVGLSIALSIVALLALAGNWLFLVLPLTGARAAAYFGELAVPLAITAASAAPAWLAAWLAGGATAGLAAGMIAGAAAYLGLSRAFNRDCLDAMRSLLFMRGAAAQDA